MLLDTVSGTNTYVKNTDYDVAGRVDVRDLGESGSNPVIKVDYSYFGWTTANGQGRLNQMISGIPTDLDSLQNLQYTYDENGNVLTIKDYLAGSPQTQTFTYDELDRLASAGASGGAYGNYGPQEYSYDPVTGNLSSRAGVSYTYYAGSHEHAVHTMGNNTYEYDANGNQTLRNIGGSTYTLTYDQENQLVSVSGAVIASYRYDGDGNRVQSTMGVITTAYIGNYFEWSEESISGRVTMKKYYYAGNTLVMMRTDSNTLNYLLGDHLGSTSIVANASGVKSGELMYNPWGNSYYWSGSVPTSFRYTGQRLEGELGLYWYGSRWYDRAAARFIQADSIVPQEQGVQAWDRYAYTNNNPVNYTDPSGHKMVCDPEDPNCNQEARQEIIQENLNNNATQILSESLQNSENRKPNIIEKLLADERTPVVTSAINVFTTDIAFIASPSLPTPLAPYSGPIVVSSYLIGRAASILSTISTGYQYKHDLNGVTRTDYYISITNTLVSAIPIPQFQVINHISLIYTGLRFLGVPSP